MIQSCKNSILDAFSVVNYIILIVKIVNMEESLINKSSLHTRNTLRFIGVKV